ncbi:transcriptional regulator, LuxR family protein [Stappia aggregata IAM 12614]|uniref:Transcriptional regulator, LuxR family protein n=1 Tax=Roseibium aggregatum (strain ATCC 25650 / DSM 13394 / JCM 20685 / NBRC 16684 / NCIMB 2208 / IAM 12614 / B1) TaxID=384765 RepID=A0P1W5_ROSAI|nr:LuxR family transcriptional regulator [Roseibium aggregatum]EAV41041.1 transcriptional regulator, LuxR family protein [Stappia aggregata IAM 12614] [Roseibium aggregatum IAM 12614]
MHAAALEDFVETISREVAPDALWQSTLAFLADAGFDKVLRVRAGVSGVTVRTTLSDGFQTFYWENGYQKDDPFLRHCMTSPVAVATGADYLDRYDYLNERSRRLILSAAEDGFRAGFSVVAPVPEQRRALGWNIGSSLRRAEVERIRQEREPLIRLALVAVQNRLDGPEAVRASLTPRELECLSLIASGLRVKAIAAELGIQPVTVELHLGNARKKLGAATREHAVALAFGSR